MANIKYTSEMDNEILSMRGDSITFEQIRKTLNDKYGISPTKNSVISRSRRLQRQGRSSIGIKDIAKARKLASTITITDTIKLKGHKTITITETQDNNGNVIDFQVKGTDRAIKCLNGIQ